MNAVVLMVSAMSTIIVVRFDIDTVMIVYMFSIIDLQWMLYSINQLAHQLIVLKKKKDLLQANIPLHKKVGDQR